MFGDWRPSGSADTATRAISRVTGEDNRTVSLRGDGGVKNRKTARLNLQVGVEMLRRAMKYGWGMTRRGDGSTVLCRTHPGRLIVLVQKASGPFCSLQPRLGAWLPVDGCQSSATGRKEFRQKPCRLASGDARRQALVAMGNSCWPLTRI